MKPNIDPKVDCVFKVLLGSEEHKALLVHFLNAVLARDPGIRISAVELLNPYNEREFETDKLSVVGVKARDAEGRVYQIEIQLGLYRGLTSRMLYTWSSIYHRQIESGENFDQLKPVIAIWLLNETLFDEPGAWHLPFVVWNRERHLTLSDDFRIHLLQLPEWPHHDQPQEDLDRWMYLFIEGKDVDAASPPAILQTNEMKEAIGVLQRFSESDREYFRYQQRLEAECLRITMQEELDDAKEEARQAKENLKRAEEFFKQAKEDVDRQAEEIKRQAEEEKRRAEEEKERLLALLKRAGIDPNASQS